MQTKILNSLLLMVFTIGIIGAGRLVFNEIYHEGTCPKLVGIPACYIILFCFITPFLVHIFKKPNSIYFIFTGFAFVIALVASILQFIGNAECPQTNNGTPMCYYSLLLFSSLMLLKLILIRKNYAPKNL